MLANSAKYLMKEENQPQNFLNCNLPQTCLHNIVRSLVYWLWQNAFLWLFKNPYDALHLLFCYCCWGVMDCGSCDFSIETGFVAMLLLQRDNNSLSEAGSAVVGYN